ncbi:MAG: hypothetical protein ABGX07_17360 [Pirellulaceae bacterium]
MAITTVFLQKRQYYVFPRRIAEIVVCPALRRNQEQQTVHHGCDFNLKRYV